MFCNFYLPRKVSDCLHFSKAVADLRISGLNYSAHGRVLGQTVPERLPLG